VIAQVPDFGDRFWVYALYDARTDQFGELGKPYGSEPGFYLLAGPNWQGDLPDGVNAVLRSSTWLANAIPRVFMDDTDEDRKAIRPPDRPDRFGCGQGEQLAAGTGGAGLPLHPGLLGETGHPRRHLAAAQDRSRSMNADVGLEAERYWTIERVVAVAA
jgi:hypothetical protein